VKHRFELVEIAGEWMVVDTMSVFYGRPSRALPATLPEAQARQIADWFNQAQPRWTQEEPRSARTATPEGK
jgi:hypothetical protein